MRVVAAAMVSLGLLACTLAFGPPAEQNLSWVFLALLAVGLELRASGLPHFGFLSGAHSIYLAAILLPAMGPIPASHLVLLGVGLRAAFRSAAKGGTAAEALSDIVPVLAAAAGVALCPSDLPVLILGLVAVTLYLPAWYGATRLLISDAEVDFSAWYTMTEALGLHRIALAGLGPILALCMAADLWAGFWIVLVLPGFQKAVENTLQRLDLDHRIRLMHQEEEMRQELARAEVHQRQLYQDLQRQLEEKALIEELTRAFASSPKLDEVLDASIAMVKRLVDCRSVVFFFPDQESVVRPRRWDSPDSQRLSDHALLDLSEPLVERCWTETKLVLTSKEPAGRPRLLENENSGAAFPLHGQGVLYVGRSSGERFRREQLLNLALVADHVAPAIVSSHRYQGLQEALQAQALANRNLKGWNQRLGFMLEGFWGMASTLSPRVIQERLVALLRQLLPHQAGALMWGDAWTFWPAEGWDREASLELASAVRSNQKPLLLDSVESSRFSSPFQNFDSLLAVPLQHAGADLGALFLCAQDAGQFQRDHQDLLSMVGLHTSALSANAQTHRDLESSQAQLAQSSKMAAVGQLAAGVAHEINSPLGAILLEVQSALRNLKKDRVAKAREKLEVAQGAARSAKDIIAKLLFYSRQAPDVQGEVDLNEVVQDSLEFLGSQVEQDGVKVVFEGSPQPPRVWGNHNQLQQILINLLLNAKDAALMEGAVSNELALRTRLENGRAVLEVEDQGPGISSEHQDKVFDPFFTTKEVGKGTGLGLSVSQQLVTKLGGELTFESQPGKTCFRVSLPCHQPRQA